MALTDAKIRAAKPRAKPYKLTDERGLFLLVQPSGGLLWRFKFRSDGRDKDGNPKRIEKKLGLGTYPEIGLKRARELRDEARAQLAEGIDPSQKKRADRAAAKISATNTFKAVAEAFIEKSKRDNKAASTVRKREWYVRLVERTLGNRPISEIAPHEILEAVRPFERASNHEKSYRTVGFIGQVFRFAVASQLADRDPTRDIRGALTKGKPKHHAAILDPARVGELLRIIDGYTGLPLTLIALRISPHLYVRPGELRRAEWSEIDFAAKVWRIPASKMKARVEHVVPLSRQSLALFQEAFPLSGHTKFVFPSVRSPNDPMSENTVNAALRRLDYTGDEMTAHGFRSMASTLLNESGKWSPDAIERALAHNDRDTIRRAYHRGPHWAERVEMAQWWSDFLDDLKAGKEIKLPVKESESMP